MTTIESLNTSITQMPFEEALGLIETIRRSRKIVKKPVKKAAVKKASSKAPRKKKGDVFTQLTDKQKLELIKKLEGG